MKYEEMEEKIYLELNNVLEFEDRDRIFQLIEKLKECD